MLIAYQVALEVVRELRPLVEQIRKHDSTLAKQLVDAANSTVQNLAEGERHRGGNKRAKFDIAHGEANEMKGSLDVALAWGTSPMTPRRGSSSGACSRCAGA